MNETTLKRLANAMRSVGMLTFQGEFEGSKVNVCLSPSDIKIAKRQRKSKNNDPVNTDSTEPSETDLLFWSSGGVPPGTPMPKAKDEA